MTRRPRAVSPLGVSIGHHTDRRGATGCTVVLCPDGAVGGVAVRGGAPCTRETDIFRPGAGVDPRRVHGVLLTGGSVFGLAACDGVVRFLSRRRIGLQTGVACIPIVGAAGLYDLAVGRATAWPDAAAGAAACRAALRGTRVAEGSVGAGTGATVGKALGIEHASKSGIGVATMQLAGGIAVQAIVAVNAFGEVVDPQSGTIVAGIRGRHGRIQAIGELLDLGARVAPPLGNTTIGVVVTNAAVNQEEANSLASVAHDGIALTIRPTHTRVDGDTLFVLSTGRGSRAGLPMIDFIALQHAAVQAVAAAILRAVATPAA